MADLELNSIGNGDGNNYLLRDNSKIPLSGSNQISGSLIPATTDAYELGTSTNKWKSINGIAPDELGLPTSTYTDVSSYITNFGLTPNTFTAPVSGLLNVVAGPATGVYGVSINNTKNISVGTGTSYDHARTILPVEQGDSIQVFISASTSVSARIFHLKGKV